MTPETPKPSRYGAPAAFFHWLIAVCILATLALGWILGQLPRGTPWLAELYQWHKTLGLSILLLMAARLLWRITHKAPPIPNMSNAKRRAAYATHWGFYVAAIALPISGWVMVSSSTYNISTLFYGLFEWPHLPLEKSKEISSNAELAHFVLAIIVSTLLATHLLATLHHQLMLRDSIITRIWPGRAVFAAALTLGLLLLLAGWLGALSGGSSDTKKASAPATTSEKRVQTTKPDLPGSMLWHASEGSGRMQISGTQNGVPSQGVIKRFDVEFSMDPDQLVEAKLNAKIDMTSITMGNEEHDQYLMGAEWFDVEQYPQSEFRSTRFTWLADDQYLVTGQLTIKSITQDIEWPMRIESSAEDPQVKRLTASFSINRLDYEAGLGFWADEAIVGLEVAVSFSLELKRQNGAGEKI